MSVIESNMPEKPKQTPEEYFTELVDKIDICSKELLFWGDELEKELKNKEKLEEKSFSQADYINNLKKSNDKIQEILTNISREWKVSDELAAELKKWGFSV